MSGLRGLLATAQKLQADMERLREDLGNKAVDAETGGGLVRVQANGRGEVLSLTIDPSLLAPDQQVMLQDLLVGAFNLAQERVKQVAKDEMARLTGGLPLPPGLMD